MKIRPQRGMFTDSMALVEEIPPTLEEVTRFVSKSVLCEANPEDIKLERYFFDPRNGWDTHLVTWMGMAVAYTNADILE